MPSRLVPPQSAAVEREAIREDAQALAVRAKRVGLDFAACLFEFAVLELDWKTGERTPPPKS
jgi:hypothetical protein